MMDDLPSDPRAPARPVPVPPDPWSALRALTPARIGLGRAGHSLPTRELLAADAAHARARAAVHVPLDVAGLCRELARLPGVAPPLEVASAAGDRDVFLMRPDLGRRLSAASRDRLREAADGPDGGGGAAGDLVVVIGDGLSTTAVARHAVPVVAAILAARPAGRRVDRLVVASQARVALGDEIGALLRARLVAMLIGERPGLSCQESLGIYLTLDPRPGRTDAERNCLSNIHPGGLSAAEAAGRLWWLAGEACRIGGTGVQLKDRSQATAAVGGGGGRIPSPEASR
jgi:ethanolamine ammonia-lyase small subunit